MFAEPKTSLIKRPNVRIERLSGLPLQPLQFLKVFINWPVSGPNVLVVQSNAMAKFIIYFEHDDFQSFK